jgi:hypothetical protein
VRSRLFRLLLILVAVPAVALAGTRIGTTTAVISFSNPSTPGQAVEFGAVTNGYFPSGTVTFSDETGVLCAAVPVLTSSSTGLAYCTGALGQGVDTVSANYSGDFANLPSTGCVVQLIGSDFMWADGFDCVRP